MDIQKNLRSLRKQRVLTQVQLSEMTGISQESIACYETGIRKPTLDNLEALAHALEVDFGDLLGERIPQVEKFTPTEARGNSRTAKMLNSFEKLRPAEQRLLLKQVDSWLTAG